MCGIFGTTEPINEDMAYRSLAYFKHRGPDVQKAYTNADITFGHNRLSILDLDERSNQPFERHGDVLVFNGEIYNYGDIRSKLVAKGHHFDTSSDTEILLKAYQTWGDEVVGLLNGMFAFVIYDRNKRRLFGARDRFGKKPFYYKIENGNFSFASNLYALKSKTPRISDVAREHYFWYGYVPGEMTILEGIHKLLPGHSFEFDLNTKQFTTSIFWKIGQQSQVMGYAEYKEQVDTLLTDAVKIRMVADVPVGIFLSGGVDSTLVTKYATRTAHSIRTFSIGFTEQAFDESKHAEEAARILGTKHTTIPCTADELLKMISNFPTYYDEPFADASAIPSMLLSKLTKEYVTVALSGDGGDEVFYGYKRYQWFYWINKIFALPAASRPMILQLLKRLYPERAFQWAFLLSAKTKEEAYIRFMGSIHGLMKEPAWLAKETLAFQAQNMPDFTMKMANWDVKQYLPDDILTKVDRASMAFSLEARSPLLDYRLIELTRTQPVSYNFSAWEGKRVLKELLAPEFNSAFINRKKQGFTLPLKEWFRNQLKEEVKYWVYDAGLLEEIDLYDNKRFRMQFEAHMRGETNFYPELWKLMVYGRWKQHFTSLEA